ncbi:glucosamine-6-phosphate deaminase [Natronincola peptidivorans]|uniref:Glucosamine-6-phosphate deaminase n=1 Tax=Natronincola peptidivorans TaxID=426128 RepID=A0A1I0BZ69_9FIRM|nr:glucosamine-6-phosphate deaminase [Natronincola peptidivorans]SET11856.1 glucosamine-6-phosphate deaminase [Natronincola peptidivorans]
MQLQVVKDYDALSKKAAHILASQIILKPKSILGLATGSTPIGTYRELINMHKEGMINFSEVVTFNLDEYYGLDVQDQQSYHYFMNQHFFNDIDIVKENIYIPNGKAVDVDAECQRYEKSIKEAGGIDLQLLGIGQNGHIGFNEPDVKFEASTHLVNLDLDTIKANARFFDSIDEVPDQAISMGVKTILSSKKILLLASGKNKAEAIYKMVKGKITPKLPASVLQLHPDVVVIADEAAAALL